MPRYLSAESARLVRRLLSVRRMLTNRGIERISGVNRETVRLMAAGFEQYRPGESFTAEEVEFVLVPRYRCSVCGWETIYTPCVACVANSIIEVCGSAEGTGEQAAGDRGNILDEPPPAAG